MDKKIKRNIGYGLLALSVVSLIYILVTPALPDFLPHLYSIWTGTSTCSSSGVGITFQFVDETAIPDCFVGNIYCYGITPSGVERRMGGYETTPTSIQKINCEGSYGDKSFVSGYITNEGAGTYTVRCAGTYYLQNENYATPHTFEVRDSVSMSCPTFASECGDGTPINMCSQTKPLYCSKYGDLYPKAGSCGCPEGLVREIGGQACVLPSQNMPPEDPEVEPYPEINEEEIITTPSETVTSPTATKIDEKLPYILGIIIVFVLAVWMVVSSRKR